MDSLTGNLLMFFALMCSTLVLFSVIFVIIIIYIRKSTTITNTPASHEGLKQDLAEFSKQNNVVETSEDILSKDFSVVSASKVHWNWTKQSGTFTLNSGEVISAQCEFSRFVVNLNCVLIVQIGADTIKITSDSSEGVKYAYQSKGMYNYYLNDELIAKSPIMIHIFSSNKKEVYDINGVPFLWHDRWSYDYRRTYRYIFPPTYNFYSDSAKKIKVASLSRGCPKSDLPIIQIGKDNVFLNFLNPNLDKKTRAIILGHLILDRLVNL